MRKAIERLIRTSVDIPRSEHIRFKAAGSVNSTTMVPELKGLIRYRVIQLEKEAGIYRK